jgi:hypothetical protein
MAWLSMIKDISEYIYFETFMHLGSSEPFFFIMIAESWIMFGNMTFKH